MINGHDKDYIRPRREDSEASAHFGLGLPRDRVPRRYEGEFSQLDEGLFETALALGLTREEIKDLLQIKENTESEERSDV
jgi:hypothetical protein